MIPNYPSWRVFIGFSICPILSGFILFLVPDFYDFFTNGRATAVHQYGFWGIWLYFILGLYGFLFFGIPASFLAWLYVKNKLYRKASSYALVFFSGGFAAHFWMLILSSLMGTEVSFENIFDFSSYKSFLFFSLGAFSSVFMACLVLPKKPF
ncbi:hypothetical protein [Aliidiomarina soli]|uniref:Uncharacterized protein n=1 Tax=Aliidiomarina soli TaxID=1928574 RepID=A0A432WE28_9GAMM|nr:hypothetical protein [Aliidiomarina soli]RUO31129.1 hypothetical protein CWE14_11580 [Aliidiomarina soli]